jgi:hypothetical protein
MQMATTSYSGLTSFRVDCILAGEIVCEARYSCKIPHANWWFIQEKIQNGENVVTTVRMKQVVAPNLTLEGVNDQNPLPNGCNRQQLTPLGLV